MGLRDLQLIFDNPSCAYLSGQTVSGRLRVVIDQPKKLRCIIATFKGEACCRWSKTETIHRNGEMENKTINYYDNDLYFENSIVLCGGTGNSMVLPPGEHFFQFSMMLPHHLPSSFEGTYGYIRYTVRATLDRPWRFNHEVMAAFTVITHLDLNLDPQIRTPFQAESTKSFCCLCCKSGPLTLVANIPVRGYVPGQNIPVMVEVDNASNIVISEVKCMLQKVIKYIASSPHGTKEETLIPAELTLSGSVLENGSRTWMENLRIPPLPPSVHRECRIIFVEYKLIVKAVPEGLHNDLVISCPITIGTVPLWQNDQQTVPAPTAPPIPLGFPPHQVGLNPASASSNPYLSPPSYEECMFGTNNISEFMNNQHMYGTLQYKPRYPTYALPLNPAVAMPGTR